MMWIVVVAVVAVLVFAIAAGTIGRETHRLDSEAPAPSLDLVDAVDWISERLPGDVASQLSYEDVRDIVTWYLYDLQREGLEQRVGGNDALVVVDDDWELDTLIARGTVHGRTFTHAQVRAVLDGELGYLAAIGAVGPLADPEAEL
jgi:hypothetical protein